MSTPTFKSVIIRDFSVTPTPVSAQSAGPLVPAVDRIKREQEDLHRGLLEHIKGEAEEDAKYVRRISQIIGSNTYIVAPPLSPLSRPPLATAPYVGSYDHPYDGVVIPDLPAMDRIMGPIEGVPTATVRRGNMEIAGVFGAFSPDEESVSPSRYYDIINPDFHC